MSLLRVVGWVVVIVVLYAVITQPVGSAATVREGVGGLGSLAESAATSMMQFGTALTRPSP